MTALSEEKRAEIGVAVFSVMRGWNLDNKQQLTLLPLDIKARVMPQYAQGKIPLPDDEEILDRAKHLLGIAHALRDFFPLNHKGGAIWLRNTNKYFLDKAPLNYMLEDGLRGMYKVWTNLDCTQGWD